MVALLPGCGGGGGGSDYCANPNAILAFAYVPNPAAVIPAAPPRDSISAPAQSDIIITSSIGVPEGYIPLAAATVSILSLGGLNVRTGDTGLFTFASLARGQYLLRIEKAGHPPLDFHATVCDAPRIETSTSSSSTSSTTSTTSSNNGSSSTSERDDGASSSGGGESSSSASRRLSKREANGTRQRSAQ